MNNTIINSIQKEYKNSINKKYSKKYIIKNILPIIEFISSSKKKKFLISGSQGVGKSTLLKVLEKILKTHYKLKVLSLSLDDYYLTKNERLILSKKIHPLLKTRGVPGTHDIKKLLDNIKSFERFKYPIFLPIFNKLSDERSKLIKKINKKADILILEGWCCGSPPISKKYLLNNINFLEDIDDNNGIWRNYYNDQLKKQYAILFKFFDKTIFLKAPSFSYIYNWRLKQEKMMSYNKNKIINKRDLLFFISHFEKITKWMIALLPSKADLVINIDKKQKIQEIFYN